MSKGPIPTEHQVAAMRPVRFVLVPENVKTIEEVAKLLGVMGVGVIGPGGYEALVAHGVDHLFEREKHTQIISPGVTGLKPS